MHAIEVINGQRVWSVEQGDAGAWFDSLPDASVDLVVASPPYEQARLYLEGGDNLGIARGTEPWVAWMVELTRKALRICRGLVAWVVEGQTKKFRYTASPLLLAADLHRAGITLRKPPIFKRVGIPGSGGPDWLRNDYEFIICATNGGKLPWSNNTAMGHPPKWAPGGEMSSRLSNGARVNQWGRQGSVSTNSRGTKPTSSRGTVRPSHRSTSKKAVGYATSGHLLGDVPNGQGYDPPVLANPGNVIECLVGGGVMGNPLCHENEAPFPESLAEFLVRSFCPEGGIVADCFSGSGTTAAVAVRWHRKAIACDLRASQVDLSRRRIAIEESLFHSQQQES